ncbi:recombination-associated protein RdgC [uncultured Haemophilus sp.]|uniref:recombination-associated protein RdgC n=1 Tax=uncultured Haemophilus sp. TaxID=237779 RepID=UPI00262DC7E2|nr:recombination-associated protein RdgC [uncultured Haemophilus sp.]
MYWFKNAIIYQLTKNIDFGEIELKLKECQFTPCEPSEISRFGWTAPLETDGNLAYFADNKVLLMAKREEKILPVDVINRELNIRIAALEEKEQRKLKKTERLSLRDDVVASLTSQAFSKFKFTALFIDLKTKLIYVDAASSKIAEDALALLRKSLGSLPVIPVSFNTDPCEVMTEWITDKEPNWLILLEEAEIREKNDLGVISCKNKSLLGEDIVELAQSGLVSKLALEWENNLKFVLRDDGTLKQLKFDDRITEQNDDISKEEIGKRFYADFILMANVLSGLLNELSVEFNGLKVAL